MKESMNRKSFIAEREVGNDKIHLPLVKKEQLLELIYELEMIHVGSVMTTSKGQYPYIPFSHLTFVRQLQKYNPAKYLEVGCGIGTKLWLAQEVLRFIDITGIEINKKYVKLAKGFLGGYKLLGIEIVEKDAMQYDKYGDYDLIYTYDPLHSDKSMNKLLDRIKDQMKSGATLLRAMFPNQFTTFVKE